MTKYFTLTPFTVTPAICEDTVTYTCTSVVGPDNTTPFNDLCDAWVYPADANGNLALTAGSTDYATYPEGMYTFTITATG